jgi:hypothetical protein
MQYWLTPFAATAGYRSAARARRSIRRWLRSVAARPVKNPVLVFGNQKSGTSAVAALLGAATGLRAQIDIRGAREPFLTPLLRHEISISDFVRRNALEFSAPIVKEPSLTFIAPELLDHFPDGRAIFIVRDPYQNIRSILNRLDVPGDSEYFVPSLSNLPGQTWVSILSGSDLGLPSLHYIETLAQRWVRAAEVYLREPERYILVRYEDFNKEKKRCIEMLSCSLGLSADKPFEHLLDHQFQRAGQPATNLHEFFGDRNLNRITEHCERTMTRIGYGAGRSAAPDLIMAWASPTAPGVPAPRSRR